MLLNLLARFIKSHKVSSLFNINKMSMYDGPIVVILGATGAGKSKLALDIASRLNGEIINADSMQVYKGLDIVTNKVTPEELKICKHHLIGFLSPLQEYTVIDFQRQALKAIEKIQCRRKLPIICGGTNYYIEAILWEFLTPTNKEQLRIDDTSVRQIDDNSKKELEVLSSTELYEILDKADPERALSLHPHDRRKIIRSIEVYRQSGQKHSDILKLQTGDQRIGGPLLFENTCLIYVDCDKEILNERINKRVDKMVETGLIDELKLFHKDYNKDRLQSGLQADYERGIFQSIGFKEFHDYLTKEVSDNNERNVLLNESIERMKISTRQYAKYQRKWIRNRIVNRENGLPVYAVDSSDPSIWDKTALFSSLKLLHTALQWGEWVENINKNNDIFKLEELKNIVNIEPMTAESNTDLSPRVKRVCHICNGQIFITDKEWQIHITSKRHKKIQASQKRKLKNTVNILSNHEKQLQKKAKETPTESTANDE
uniref:tRNA dimethylallyltransferase-like n=1 Tax=Styela clava TaxID=7725 RepID=UPI00193A92F0|nr:tRNA dimethylallyltransferase-like [Styela clava]